MGFLPAKQPRPTPPWMVLEVGKILLATRNTWGRSPYNDHTDHTVQAGQGLEWEFPRVLDPIITITLSIIHYYPLLSIINYYYGSYYSLLNYYYPL